MNYPRMTLSTLAQTTSKCRFHRDGAGERCISHVAFWRGFGPVQADRPDW
jgi:hypothetical protein